MDQIIDNILEYRNREGDLVRALRPYGVDTCQKFLDIISEYMVPLPSAMRNAIKTAYDNLESDDWQEACNINTIDAYQEYLSRYPSGIYINQANSNIDRINLEIESDGYWSNLDKGNIDLLKEFISKYPLSSHRDECQLLIASLTGDTDETKGNVGCAPYNPEMDNLTDELQKLNSDKSVNDPESAKYELIKSFLSNGKIVVNDLLTAIREDNNYISSSVVYKLIKDEIILDFSSTGISPRFIKYAKDGIFSPKLPACPPPIKVTKSPSVEVYFWGIPSSGKTCALGAILSAASKGTIARSMEPEADCQGWEFMDRLSTMFDINNHIGVLPLGNQLSATFEMGFDLEDNRGMIHPITFVDLSGELIDAMYMFHCKQQMPQSYVDALKNLTNLLVANQSKNKKIHFFVIEYGAAKAEYNGKPQASLLSAAAQYIKKTNVFENNTSAIYILISKADKAGVQEEELVEVLTKYMEKDYRNFYNILTNYCKNNKINNGIVEIKPFSIGKVCFQNYCEFNDEAANDVVRTLLRVTPGYTPKELRKLNNKK